MQKIIYNCNEIFIRAGEQAQNNEIGNNSLIWHNIPKV